VVISLFQAINKVPLIRAIIDWVVAFIIDYVALWIIERGGWVSRSRSQCIDQSSPLALLIRWCTWPEKLIAVILGSFEYGELSL
jgi:hypothetical protein